MTIYPTAIQDKAVGDADGRVLLLQAITSGNPDTFNAWRASNPRRLIVIKGQNLGNWKLQGYSLSNIVFMNTSFTSCEFVNSDISEVSFRDCDWNLVKFTNCKLIGLVATSIEAHGVTFNDCRMMGCDMRGAIMDLAKFTHSDSTRSFYNHANLSKASINNSNFCNVHFNNANLAEIKCDQSNMSFVDFRSANLTESIFLDCDLTEAMFWNVQIGGWTLRNINCTMASFDEEGQRKIKFSPSQFERLYGGDLRVNLTFKGGIIVSELLAIPAIIESIRREFPGSEIVVSSIHELGDMAEVTVTAKCPRILDKDELSQLETHIAQRFSMVMEFLRSNDQRIERINERMQSSLHELTELIVMNTKPSITFSGQVTAGVIGGDANTDGSMNVNSLTVKNDIISAEDLTKLIDVLTKLANDLDVAVKEKVLGELNKIDTSKPKESATILKEVGNTIRNICEGAVGSITASEILTKIAQLGW